MNKYINLSNNDRSYQSNQHGSFISNIGPLILKKKYKIAITDFNYVNNISRDFGEFQIVIRNLSEEDINNHIIFCEDFENKVKEYERKIKKLVTRIEIRDTFENEIIDGEISPDYEEVKRKVNDFKENVLIKLENYIDNNKNKNFTYRLADSLQIFLILFQSIKNLPAYTSFVRDFIWEDNIEKDFKIFVDKIENFVFDSVTKFKFIKNFVLYDRSTFEDFFNYLTEITQFFNFISLKFESGKILVNLSSSFEFKCSEMIQKYFKCKVNLSSIVLTVPKLITFIKNLYISTDIIEENQYSQFKKPILQVIKPEGQYLENNTKSFERPRYFNVNKSFINFISIIITDQNNEIVNFETSPLITLHIFESK